MTSTATHASKANNKKCKLRNCKGGKKSLETRPERSFMHVRKVEQNRRKERKSRLQTKNKVVRQQSRKQ